MAKDIIPCGLYPIIEPEAVIGCPDKAGAEPLLLDAMLVAPSTSSWCSRPASR